MKYRFLFFATFFFISINAQTKIENNPAAENKPKLVIGIVVDQMRYDYLTRFWDKYSENGFKKLINEGYNLKNNHFNYVPTYTGPGHASVFTGATPEVHGIIGNYWYSRNEEDEVYCAGDENVAPVGTSSSAGKMSPHRMLTTSIADENRLHTQMRGKTIGVALKDRGAILPAGHTANAAYWFHGKDEGKFISSTHYLQNLPNWVKQFNKSGIAKSYLKEWNTLYDIASYVESGEDKNLYEGGFDGKEFATFPYDLNSLKNQNNGFDILKAVPYGNSLTLDFALAAIDGEALGQDEFTDFLTLSFSSTDYVGHNFGVNSKEVEDTYLRLDKDIARLLKELDKRVGKGNYTIFLTADHAGVHVPAYLKSLKIPAGLFSFSEFQEFLNEKIMDSFGSSDLIEEISNNQVFFDYEKIAEAKIDIENLEKMTARFALQFPHVNKVFTRSQMTSGSFTKGISNAIQNGFHQKRSGDLIIELEPSTISYSKTGSTHGSGFNYDTHVPLIFYGNGINRGSSFERTEITDIAPTIAALLGISFPSGSTGNPLIMVLAK
ncbi:MAG TPA: alkaline phosphatase PafA [Salinimicrobium sp.]|nr:alkaline phosphatase PafA [Salinimicrobium sp.]